MGYRLHATIPNIKPYDDDLELGKQYDSKWNDFNNKWFGTTDGIGMVFPDWFDEFLADLKMINQDIIENEEEYDLYNIELLEKMFQFAKENNYYIYFRSY